MRRVHRHLLSTFTVSLIGMVAFLALTADAVFATGFTSDYWKWTPRIDAKITGVTTVSARRHTGSGPTASDAVRYTTFRANNTTTRFYDKDYATGRHVRVSRNTFFRHVRNGPQPQRISLNWTWKRRSNGTRYRFITSVTSYHAYRANSIALFGDSLFETRYLDSAENPGRSVLPVGYDGRLQLAVHSKLHLEHGVHASVQNWSVGGIDSSDALRAHYRVRNGVTGVLGPSTVSPWGDVLAARPRVVVINFGAVDVGHGINVVDFKRNIETMVTQARARGIVVVLATCLAYDYPTHFSYDRNAQLKPYSDAIAAVAAERGVELADNRAAFEASIAAGTWDLFGRNDSTYLPRWENGSTPGTVAYETQHHPWVAGVRIMARTIADAVVRADAGSPAAAVRGVTWP